MLSNSCCAFQPSARCTRCSIHAFAYHTLCFRAAAVLSSLQCDAPVLLLWKSQGGFAASGRAQSVYVVRTTQLREIYIYVHFFERKLQPYRSQCFTMASAQLLEMVLDVHFHSCITTLATALRSAAEVESRFHKFVEAVAGDAFAIPSHDVRWLWAAVPQIRSWSAVSMASPGILKACRTTMAC